MAIARAAVRLVLAALLTGWTSCAWSLHVVSDAIPDGALNIPAGGRAAVFLDIERDDFLQWTWTEQSAQAGDLSTQLIWTDVAGREHVLAPLPLGQTFGNFTAPRDLLGARIEWHNAGAYPHVVAWSYYTSAPFWQRPEYFLPAMLPLFLLAGAFYFGRRIDQRHVGAGRGDSLNPTCKVLPQEMAP